ncbi:MAG: LON peptidase substrate-binding domain-containing protein [Planctomycetota bacterium]|jgi:Lon protease-like protein|nr:LON peptidase substrate-binding domain-containing protein [Planctomycetota bacterium]
MSSRLPLFALPNLMLYPEAVIPLHLFEPRYLQLMQDLLANGKHDLLIGTLLPGWEEDYFHAPPIAKVAGVGEVMQSQRDEQGNYNIVLRGKYRAVVIDEKPSGKPYRVIEVEEHPEIPITGSEASLAHAQLLHAITSLAGATPEGADAQTLNYLTDILLVHLPIEMDRKLKVFCELHPIKRATKVLKEFKKQQAIGRSFPSSSTEPEDPQWN